MVQVDEVRVAVEYEMLAAGLGRSDVDGPDLLDIDLLDAVDRRGERQADAGAHRARIIAETGDDAALLGADPVDAREQQPENRSEEHTSELQSLMRISYAVFRLKNKNKSPDRLQPHSSQTSSILNIKSLNIHTYIAI